MPAKIVSRATAEHYTWGGPNKTDCDGWYLVRASELSVIEEAMPPGTQETRHHHARSRQFFYVLDGELTLEVEHHEFVLHAGEGLEIAPGQAHQARNRSQGLVRMVVTSQPPSHGDRVED
jgi:mannose-6-phosphate isomerase-like protein (cupin superfamily)